MLPYAAYLRVYEPLTVFPEPARSLWQVYADSPDRPRAADALRVEHTEALHRMIGTPQTIAPAAESRHAYVRRVDDDVFVCPWQTRLRSWLRLAEFRGGLVAGMRDAFVPEILVDEVERAFERWREAGGSLRPHVLSTTWHVPPAWFVPFAATERRLTLPSMPDRSSAPDRSSPDRSSRDWSWAQDRPAGDESPGGDGRTAAASIRTLRYVASMADAGARVRWAAAVLRTGRGEGPEAADGPAAAEVAALGEWLAGFHHGSLVELDYGGLVHLIDDQALRSDQSAAEVAAGLTAMDLGQAELAVAMHRRLVARWRPVRALATAN